MVWRRHHSLPMGEGCPGILERTVIVGNVPRRLYVCSYADFVSGNAWNELRSNPQAQAATICLEGATMPLRRSRWAPVSLDS